MHTRNFTVTKVILPVDVGQSVLVSVSNESVKGFKELPFLKDSQSSLPRTSRHKRDGTICREAEDGRAGPSQMPRNFPSLRCHSSWDFWLSLTLDSSLSFYLWCEQTGKSQASTSDYDSLPEAGLQSQGDGVAVEHLPSVCQALDSTPVRETDTHKKARMECEH